MSVRQFVTFRIDDHLLGIDVLGVREINRALEITPVPRSPAYVRGLVNLRGQIVTVFDLGVRLGFEPRLISETTHNVILKSEVVGLMVDAIGDVAQTDEEDVEPPPANVGGIEGEFIEGVVKLERELLVILSAEKLLRYAPASTGDGVGL
ncbi:MAG: chemotaxis protein CheW [Pseudomonadota bacterium]